MKIIRFIQRKEIDGLIYMPGTITDMEDDKAAELIAEEVAIEFGEEKKPAQKRIKAGE